MGQCALALWSAQATLALSPGDDQAKAAAGLPHSKGYGTANVSNVAPYIGMYAVPWPLIVVNVAVRVP